MAVKNFTDWWLGTFILCNIRNVNYLFVADHFYYKKCFQKEEIQSALTELRSTQAQPRKWLHSWMHHLHCTYDAKVFRFINNFLGVNTALIVELKGERSKAKAERNEDLEEELNDIKESEQKINHHGKQAYATVKGMLQHSRASTGQKEPTDTNGLADEYLCMRYHGSRAKDKSFNATIETHFDESVL